MEVPENGVTGWLVAGAVSLATAAAAMVRSIIKRSRPSDEDTDMFRKHLCRDMGRLEAKIDKAIEHADEAHQEMFRRVGRLEQRVAVIEDRGNRK